MFMNDPLVTVMMPVFNGLPMIQASIESLLAQTYSNWECIIVDDGSTDGTSDFLDTLTDRRFIVFHFAKNLGRSFARQKALDLARGKYLAMIDADDIYSPLKLERQVFLLETHPEVQLVSSAMCSFGINTHILRKRGTNREIIVDYNGTNVPLHASSMLLLDRAKCFKYNLFLKLGEDADFLSRYLVGCKYFLDPYILYYYSEFDSVTKKKILDSYKGKIVIYTKDLRLRKAFVNLVKFCIQKVRFMFYTTDKILASRGKPLTEYEKLNFRLECLRFINHKYTYEKKIS